MEISKKTIKETVKGILGNIFFSIFIELWHVHLFCEKEQKRIKEKSLINDYKINKEGKQ